ncbi:hypothetical protein J5N97_014935 [Dioscorea zingiberensis]|uniref:Gnk2-homologous domain-containing protein n=1 Tax=Dioscorea zingiberensis TaxID=325984 RepID=A0A9D5CTA7_9LILI|nr:hypothetical protein J5N97_014935 [Dioscorea zingiberensis]
MASLGLYHLLFFLILQLSTGDDPIGQYCDNKSFKNNNLHVSINAVLADDLTAKASIGGFATTSSGHGDTLLYGLAQCRGDLSAEHCSACITNASKALPSLCPIQADERVWYDYCFMRYDTSNLVGDSDTSYALILYNVENATDPEEFDKEVGLLMSEVRAMAVKQENGGFGKGTSEFTPLVTIYGLAQCTRHLRPLTCAQCLSSAVEEYFAEYCTHRKGCRVLYI